MLGKKLILEGWFSLGTEQQSDIEDRAREKFGPDGEDPEYRRDFLRKGLINEEGEITKKGWDVLNDDIGTLERNALKWLDKNLEYASDEGHGDSGDLTGGFSFDARNPKQLEIVNVSVEHGIDESSFDLDKHAWKGLSDFGASFLDVHIYLNLDRDDLDKANALEAWERTERRRQDR